MPLTDYALSTVASLKAYMGKSDEDLKVPVLSIYNDSSDATAATVQVTDVAVVLVVTGGTNAGTETLTLADADKDTITELAAAINALAKGWNAEVLRNGAQASGDLSLVPSTGALNLANKQSLQAPDNPAMEILINVATDIIEHYCGRRFKKTTYTDELHDGPGAKDLILHHAPINSVSSIAYTWPGATADHAVDTNGYQIYANEGLLRHYLGVWTKGDKNIKITYDAGYDFTGGIPVALADVQDICNALAAYNFKAVEKAGIKSERMGSYSVTYRDVAESGGGDIPESIRGRMDRWVLHVF